MIEIYRRVWREEEETGRGQEEESCWKEEGRRE